MKCEVIHFVSCRNSSWHWSLVRLSYAPDVCDVQKSFWPLWFVVVFVVPLEHNGHKEGTNTNYESQNVCYVQNLCGRCSPL